MTRRRVLRLLQLLCEPVAEAMLLIVLMDHALRHRAQCADVRCPTPRIAARAGTDIDNPTGTPLYNPEPEEDC